MISTNPIFQAVLNNNTLALDTAITNGNTVNIYTDEGISPLDLAIIANKFFMVNPLIDKIKEFPVAADKTKMLNQGMLTLMKNIKRSLAANPEEDMFDENRAFDSLLNENIDVNMVDENNTSLLFYAIETKQNTIVQKLLTANVNVNVENNYKNTPLFHAFIYNNLSIIPSLIEKTTDFTKVDGSNRSYAHYAVMYNSPEIFNLLTAKLVTIADIKDDLSENSLHYAINYSVNEAFISAVASKISNINTQNYAGNTALHLAIEKSNFSTSCVCKIKMLVNTYNASLYIKNSQNMMPIEMPKLTKAMVSELC
jgi:ankyrin repeat protein